MSLDNIDKITRNADEVQGLLRFVSMPYEIATDIDAKLRVMERMVDRSKEDHAEELKDLVDIIEGLLANWPHTEMSKHYTQTERPVLMKDEALTRAGRVVKNRASP